MTLSRRQREVVQLVALRYTGPEIAEELQLAHDTVRTHVRNAMAAGGARSADATPSAPLAKRVLMLIG